MPEIVVKVITDTGVVGYGESVSDEHMTGKSVYNVFTALKHHLIPAILHKDNRNIQEIHNKMNQTLVKNGEAKATLYIECYNILYRVSNLPIYSLLGGRKKEESMIPRVMSILEPNVLAQQAQAALHEGYKEITMKLGTDPVKDVARVKAVRE